MDEDEFDGEGGEEFGESALTEKIIGCAYKASNGLGIGFLEKVYENAMLVELRKAGLKAEPQQQIEIFYQGVLVGEYFADILAEGRVLLELKVARAIDPLHLAQAMNYLRASNLRVALVLNFGTTRVGIKRIIF